MKRPALLVLLLILVPVLDRILKAAEMPQPETRVKAMFLYNFALFTDWPSAAKSPLTFCIVGEDRIAAELEALTKGKMVADRNVMVRSSSGALSQILECRVIYVGKSERNRIPQIVRSIQGRSTLVVSEFPDSGKDAAAINFFTEQNKMRFAVCMEAASNAGVVLRSNVLRLARIVDENR